MASSSIPETMKRLVVTEVSDTVAGCTFNVETVPVPQVGPGQALIRVAAAAVNPSDYGSWLRAKPDQLPYACGKEGCGVVVKIGEGGGMVQGLLSSWVLRAREGMKVGFISLKNKQGSYSEYVLADLGGGVFPMPDDMPIEDAASFFVNPYTSIAICDTAKAAGSPAFIHTAAASQLGQMMVQLAPTEGVEVVNVVRRSEQADVLKELGAKHVVVTADAEWKETLKQKVEELGVKVAFDAVAGDSTGDMIDVLPKGGTCYVYGFLGGKCSNIDPVNLIYHNKKVEGFVVTNWVTNGGMLHTIPRMMSAGKKVNAGLKDGWSKTKFRDTTLADVQKDLVALLNDKATGIKLRVRLDG